MAGLCPSASAAHIWINEFHYDNPGTDFGEFIEVAISTPNMSGFGPSDYALEFYNGSNNDLYNSTGTLDTFSVTGPFLITGTGNSVTLYTIQLPANGLQNGSPDGIALVNITNSTVESFLSYEGVMTADADSGGIAGMLGATSIDVGVTEPGVGNLSSLSATGVGVNADDFDAGSFVLTETQTPGAINAGQTLAVPEPGIPVLVGLGGLAFIFRRRRR